jgi:hypothetical protein
MGFFDKIKDAAGVGTPTMIVDITGRPSKRGDVLQAIARLKGGIDHPYKLRYFIAELTYEGKWTVRNADGNELFCEGRCWVWRDKIPNCDGLMIEPAKVYDIPIAIRVPSDTPLSTGELRYKFSCMADIDGAPDPEFHADLEIVG